jgi:hypothetical protein
MIVQMRDIEGYLLGKENISGMHFYFEGFTIANIEPFSIRIKRTGKFTGRFEYVYKGKSVIGGLQLNLVHKWLQEGDRVDLAPGKFRIYLDFTAS